MKRRPFLEKFLEKISKGADHECWPWTAHLVKDGYGGLTIWEGTPRVKRTLLAHRVMWELTYGSIPKGSYVCHHCDNPKCVNPDHLYLGNGATNMLDMWKRKRHRLGSRDALGRFRV